MKIRRRSKARGLWLVVIATLAGIALVLFPLKGKSAGRTDAGSEESEASELPGAVEKNAPIGGLDQKGKPSPAGEKAAASKATASPEAPSNDATTIPKAAEGPSTAGQDLTTIPIGKGLPVRVNVAVFFLELTSFDDTKGEFEATTDVRLRWTDPRLAFPAEETLRGYREFIGKAAEEHLATIWSPTIDVKNQIAEGSYVGRRLRIFHDGHVESITRKSGTYKVPVRLESFPFDRQKLTLRLIVREATVDHVILAFDKDDVEFSRAAPDAKLDGWRPGLVNLKANVIAGWNGDRYATTRATLVIARNAASSIAPVFIPLLASLLIPLLALWMNRATDEGFEVDAFELANMGIGGLFSVIALSFAIYSANPNIAGSDNTVTRLFGLNYAMLALSLCIVVVFFRYELPRRWFGIHVQKETFHFLSWATPVLSLATSIAFLLVAAA